MGKGQKQRILFEFGLWSWCKHSVEESWSFLGYFCSAKISVWELFAIFSNLVHVFFKETMELLSVYRKMIFQLGPYIWQLWIAMSLSLFSFFNILDGGTVFGVLSGKMTFPLFTCVSLYCEALAFLLLSSFLCWTLLLNRRHRKARHLTKAGPEGEEWGHHILLGMTIKFSTLRSSL